MIYLDNEKTEKKTPSTLKEISSGEHSIKLQRPWYQPKTKKVTVEDEKTTHIKFNLKPVFANIIVKTSPSAKILIDGQVKGISKWNGRLMEGIYTIKVEKNRYYSQEQQIKVKAGKDISLNFDLKGKSGNVDIVTNPMNAKVIINNEKLGTTPITLKNMLIGKYNIKLEKKGYGTIVKTISINENKTVRIDEELTVGKKVTITSKPEGAKLYINDRPQGKTPKSKTLSFGRHNIKLINGEREVSKKINISENGKTRFLFDVMEFKDKYLERANKAYALKNWRNAYEYYKRYQNLSSSNKFALKMKICELQMNQYNAGFVIYSYDSQSPIGISFGHLNKSKLSWYLNTKMDLGIFKVNAFTIDNSGTSEEMDTWTWWDGYLEPTGEMRKTNIAISGGITFKIFYPLWGYLGSGIGYFRVDERVKEYNGDGSLDQTSWFRNVDESKFGMFPEGGIKLKISDIIILKYGIMYHNELIHQFGLGFKLW